MLEKAFLLQRLERAPAIVAHAYTMLLVIIGWTLFAIDDFSHLREYLGVMFGIGGAGFASAQVLYYLRDYGVTLVILIFASLPVGKKLYDRTPEKVRLIAVPVCIVLVLTLATAYLVDSTYNPFLYFRF